MSGQCFGSSGAERNIEEADDSNPIENISASCTEDEIKDKIMYFNTSDDGWWDFRLGHSPSGEKKSAPQYLKVLVDCKKSSKGEGKRYYFTVLEGAWVVESKHYKDAQDAYENYKKGNVSKKSGTKDVLVEQNSHTEPAKITMEYQKHSFLEYKGYGAASITGKINYAGVEKMIRMTGDIIKPNVFHPISIPAEKNTNYKKDYGETTFYHTWFRLDAETAGANLTSHGQASDRFVHLGRGSAGCFTNVYEGGNDEGWNKIAKALMQARAGENQLYVGEIQLKVDKDKYEDIRKGVIELSEEQGLKKYIWENEIHDLS